jgi:hypothetical protein
VQSNASFNAISANSMTVTTLVFAAGKTINFAVLVPGALTNWLQFGGGVLTNISTTAP